MNEKDLMNALSGIDEKYIDEAAYELHDKAAGDDRVVDITSKRRFGKFVKIVLPSVAAIILIVCVALPAVLRVSKSESAAMSDSAPAVEDAAADAEAPAYDEAAVPESEPETAEAESASESTEEAASTSGAASETSNLYDATPAEDSEEVMNIKPDREDADRKKATQEVLEIPAVSEAEYDRNILVVRFDSELSDIFINAGYRLTRQDASGSGSLVSEGFLGELSERISIDGRYLVVNFAEHPLETGKYRLSFGDTFAEFEVK